jgi:hypothetical protein
MKSVRIYYAGIPAKNTNKEKELVLDNFHIGVPVGQSVQERRSVWQPSNLAVLQGWVHENSGTTPHLMFRREIINKQKSIGKHTLAIDSNLFLYRDPGNTKSYLRFSLNDIFPVTGNYFTNTIDPNRWKQISRDLNFNLKDWRTQGHHILICLQRNGGWSMGSLDVMSWLKETIKTLKTLTDRPIIVRAHPGDKKVKNYLHINEPNVTISSKPSIINDLQNAWATITYNSSPGVASAIEGVPVFVTDPNPKKSQAYAVANISLNNIENPIMSNRQEWIEGIAMSHFDFKDLKSGTAWNIIKEYL